MGIADGNGHSLSRVAFKITDASGNVLDTYEFKLNPQNIQENITNRAAYLNTNLWGTTQEIGTGQRTLTISGTTGWRHGEGFDDFKKLREFLTSYTDSRNNAYKKDDMRYLQFWNYTDDYEYLVAIAPNGFQFTQDVSEPILIRYSISMIERGPLDTATSEQKTETVVGDPGASEKSNGGVQANTQYSSIGNAVRTLGKHAL